MIKGAASQQVEGLELFALEKGSPDWSDVFYEVTAASQILGRTYRDTHCYYNFEEAIIIPQQKFSVASAENYLALVYGESNRHDFRYDTLLSPGHIVNAYRIRKSIHELLGRLFILYKPHHSYSKMLDDILTRDQLEGHFVKIQFYTSHIILAFVKDKQLQLVQSFQYQTTDDILYYLSSIIQQFGIHKQSQLEISGMFDTDSILYQQLGKLFGLISFDTIQPDGLFAHYLTPFYKLAV